MIVLCSTLCFAPVSTLFLSLYYVSWCQLFNDDTTNLVNAITEGIGYSSFGVAVSPYSHLYQCDSVKVDIVKQIFSKGLCYCPPRSGLFWC